MRHKRYHNWMMLGALMLGPASAQAELTPDGGPVTVAEAAGDESALFANNSAAAIDQDGNVGVAYTVRDNGDLQVFRAFGPDGDTARYEAPAVQFEAFSTPIVSAIFENSFVLGRYSEGESGELDFTLESLRLAETSSTKGIPLKEQGLTSSDEVDLGLISDQVPLNRIVNQHGIDCKPLKVNWGQATAIFRIETENRTDYVLVEAEATVTCEDSKKVLVSLLVSQPIERLIFIEFYEYSARVISPGHDHPGKNHGVPPARAPISATGRNRDTTIMTYLANPLSGSAYGKVTLAELGEELEVTNLEQIDDPLPKRFPGTSLATCGYAEFAHYWVAWPTDEGRTVAARFEGDGMEVFDLGASNGAVDLACDGWGNAVVSWAAPDEGSGPVIHTAALGPDGSTLSEHEQTLAPDAFPDPNSAKVSNDLNEAGEVVVAWSDGGNKVAFQRLKLDGHFKVDGTLSGSHFSPAFDGEGFIFDVVEIDGTPTMVIYYFTYNDNGSGDPTWLVGSGPIEDNRAVADMITGSGATFGDAFDPEDVERKPAGTVTATFLSCGLVLVEADSNRFGQQAYIAGPLTGLPLAVDGQCGAGPAGTAEVDASRGGSHFTLSRDGEGFILDIVEIDGTPTLVAYYFTYQPDGSGDPAWMVGTGPIEGDSATVTMTIAEGATFGPDFDPADVARTEWGEITFTWQTCEDVLIEYDGLWGEGSFNVEPLTPPLIGSTGLCAP